MQLNENLEDYTEQQFLELVTKIWAGEIKSEKEQTLLVRHFEKITEHPRRNGVIFHPDPEMEDSPQGIVDFIKNWRATNGKPGFKQA